MFEICVFNWILRFNHYHVLCWPRLLPVTFILIFTYLLTHSSVGLKNTKCKCWHNHSLAACPMCLKFVYITWTISLVSHTHCFNEQNNFTFYLNLWDNYNTNILTIERWIHVFSLLPLVHPFKPNENSVDIHVCYMPNSNIENWVLLEEGI